MSGPLPVKSLLLFAILAMALPAGAELNLTPTLSERVQEGITFPQLCFSDNGKKVTYEQPRGWSYSVESKQKIAFYPPHSTATRAEIEAGFPLVPAEFDEEGVKRLKSMFLGLLPKDSEERAIVAEARNPVLINGRPSYEVTASFVRYGQRLRISILFANLPGEQIRCKVVSNPDQFEQAHGRFIETLYGLQWL
jgi:hypothetical protein